MKKPRALCKDGRIIYDPWYDWQLCAESWCGLMPLSGGDVLVAEGKYADSSYRGKLLDRGKTAI